MVSVQTGTCRLRPQKGTLRNTQTQMYNVETEAYLHLLEKKLFSSTGWLCILYAWCKCDSDPPEERNFLVVPNEMFFLSGPVIRIEQPDKNRLDFLRAGNVINSENYIGVVGGKLHV